MWNAEMTANHRNLLWEYISTILKEGSIHNRSILLNNNGNWGYSLRWIYYPLLLNGDVGNICYLYLAPNYCIWSSLTYRRPEFIIMAKNESFSYAEGFPFFLKPCLFTEYYKYAIIGSSIQYRATLQKCSLCKSLALITLLFHLIVTLEFSYPFTLNIL